MTKKVLVIDDNRMMLKFLTKLLEKEGHEVVTAEDGFAALDILTSYVPDVIFVDLIMPKIGGDKLCQIVRKMEHLKDCYLVLISAAIAEIEYDYSEIGADTCIAKGPFQAMGENVLSVIENIDSPGKKDESQQVMGLENVYARRMTKELLSRNRHLETILESISEGILELFEGRIVYANTAASDIFGIPQEKMLAATPIDLFDPAVKSTIASFFQDGSKTPIENDSYQPVELNDRLVMIKNLPVKDVASTRIIIISDITEQKRLEMQLQHVQKMEAIGTIASGVAHNFRNTLAGILVNSQVLQMDYPDDTGLYEITERINTSVKRGAELVDGLTQFSRKQTKKTFQHIDLTAITNEVYQLIRELFDKNISIHMELPESLPILGDHAGISQALMNLCTNARDAMPMGGQLTITGKRTQNQVLIRIADTGYGMEKSVIDKCFDPFFTTKAVGKGTGLGLSTAYGIVKTHDGKITIDSTPNQGTTFDLIFPLADDLKPKKEIDSSEFIKGNNEKILVVDDEVEILEAMPKLLKGMGFQPLLARNGMEAIELYKTLTPDVVLMDRNMPEMDGIACTRKIMDLDSEAKIFIFSGYDLDGPDGISENDKTLFKGYLTKPIEAKNLSILLDGVLNSEN